MYIQISHASAKSEMEACSMKGAEECASSRHVIPALTPADVDAYDP